ncbi:response regulator transcription factor [Pseudomonas boanensis]|uniref:helix-turn-helix transcriptional regulator n=1 Tax=Metapseudomonas boanensis TaxID=2822138 RepID=UPI0035D41F31
MLTTTSAVHPVATNTLAFLSDFLNVDSLAFYTVEPHQGGAHFELLNVPRAFYQDYIRHGQNLDPFAATRAQRLDCSTALLTEHISDKASDKEFSHLLSAHGFADTVEIFFRCRGELLGGVSILMNESQCSDQVRQSLYKKSRMVQPFIEFSVTNILARPLTLRLDEWIASHANLSRREISVARLVAQGNCNKKIAEALSITVATVKTHLVHIFEKTGVQSRAELIARMNS